MIIDQMREADRIEYLENLLNLERLTLESVTKQRDELQADLEFRRGLFQVQEQQLNDVRAQRDRAQSKIENQAERIKYLEGATNHATGTPLSKMREQRDRLAEAALAVVDRWKAPYWDEVGQYHYIDALRKAVEEVKGDQS
jgi:chromosome segregation ATPase